MRGQGYRRHGMSKTPVYKRWHSMKSRCEQPSDGGYKNYGARGISYCEEWESFENFYAWAIGAGYEPHLSLDREDNDSDYCPDNCRWVCRSIQSRNTRKLSKNNTTGFRGVVKNTWNPKVSWVARIRVNYKVVQLGSYKTPEQAAKAYDNFVVENNLEHTLNFD